MKKLILLLGVVIFYNSTLKGQPIVPSTSPFTRTLLPLLTSNAWATALGLTGGGGGTNITVVGSTNVTFTTNLSLTTFANNYSVPITIQGSTIELRKGGATGYAALSVTISGGGGTFNLVNPTNNFIVGQTSSEVAIPTFTVPSGSTWTYADISSGTSNSAAFTVTGAQVTFQSPVNPQVGFITAPVSIANGGTGQTTAAAGLTALGGASLTASNSFGTNGNGFNSIVWLTPYIYVVPGATITIGNGSVSATGSAGAFQSMVSAQLYGRGFQIFIPTNSAGAAANAQLWVAKVTDATHLTTTFANGAANLTGVSFQIYAPIQMFNDITPNVQGGIESDGTVWSASGSISQNAVGGGFYNEDGTESSLVKHLNMGGIFGEAWGIYFIKTHNLFPSFYISTSAAAGAAGVLPSGLLDLEVGLTNDTGSVLIANPNLANTISVPATNTAPANILTPARYMAITVGGTNYRVQLFQ